MDLRGKSILGVIAREHRKGKAIITGGMLGDDEQGTNVRDKLRETGTGLGRVGESEQGPSIIPVELAQERKQLMRLNVDGSR